MAVKSKEEFKYDQDFFRGDIKHVNIKTAQYAMVKLATPAQSITAVSCGNAHALLLTAAGTVLSLYGIA